MKTCDFCGKALTHQRTDARFCQVNCRVKYYQHHKKWRQRQAPIINYLQKHQDNIASLQAQRQQQETLRQEALYQLYLCQKQIKQRERLLGMSDDDFRRSIAKVPDIAEYDPSIKGHPVEASLNQVQNLMHVFHAKGAVREEVTQLLEKASTWQRQRHQYGTEINRIDTEVVLRTQKISQCQQQLEELTQEQQIQDDQRLKRYTLTKENPSSSSAGISLSDFLAVKFKTFTLKGILGEFLGQLERQQLSIALTGDPGAGKSYLLGALAQLFSREKLSVCYYQLELGLGHVFQQILTTYPANFRKVTLRDQASIEDLREDAQRFDCILIDSFGKVSEDHKAIDQLRKQFPKTIFIFIFQKTSGGKIRGGARVDFDSSMIIDVVRKEGRPTAQMRKSRYGTQGWEYDILADEISQRFDV